MALRKRDWLTRPSNNDRGSLIDASYIYYNLTWLNRITFRFRLFLILGLLQSLLQAFFKARNSGRNFSYRSLGLLARVSETQKRFFQLHIRLHQIKRLRGRLLA